MKKILSLLCVIFILFQIGTIFVSAADVVEYYQDFTNITASTLTSNGFGEVDAKNNANVSSAITVEAVPIFGGSEALKIYTKGLSSVTSGTDCFAGVRNVDLMGETVIKVDVAFDNAAQTKSLLLRYQQTFGMFFTIMSIGPDPSNPGKGRINFNGQTGASDYITLNPNEKYSLAIALNRTAFTGSMKVKDKDGVLLGTLSSTALSNFTVEAENATSLRFQNMPGQDNEGSFYIDNIAVCKAAAPTSVTTIPADGSQFLDASALTGFTVNWGVAVDSSSASAVLKKLVGTDYALVAGASVDYGAKTTNISFTSEYDTKYKVELSGFKTIIEDAISASEYYFSTRSEFVLPPTASILSPENNKRINPGASVLISAYAESLNVSGSITKVEFYADNILLGSDTTAPYEYNYTPANGQHKLHIIAHDNFGMTTKSDEITINVKINEPPVITTGLKEGATVDAASGMLSVNCTDDSSVENVSVFVDDEFFGELTLPPYVFSLNGLSPTKHSLRIEATDNEGLGSSLTINEFFSEYRYNLYIAGSTSDMASLGGNLSVVDNRGSHEFVTIDPDYGTSLKISDSTETGGTPYMVMAAGDFSNPQKRYSVSADIYLPDTAVTFDCFTLRYDNATFYTPIQFLNGSINGITYAKDKWYNLRFEFSVGQNSSYSVFLDGVEIKTDTMNPAGVPIDNLRFTLTAPGKSIYIDNIATYTYFAFPSVSGMQFTNSSVTTANAKNVPCDVSEIKIDLSAELGSASFSNTYVAIKDVNGVEIPVIVTKGVSNKQIVIANANILKNSTKYNIVFKKDLYVISGDRLPEDIIVQFKTAASDFDIIDSGIYENGKRVNSISGAKGKNISFKLDVCNNTSSPNNLVAICAVYKGNEMVDVTYKLISAAAGTPSIPVTLSEIAVPNEDNLRIEAYVWDSFMGRNSFSAPVIIK